MEEWLYHIFLTTGSVEAYLLLKELSDGREGEVTNGVGITDDSGWSNHQGV